MVVYELFTGQSPNSGELSEPLKFAHRVAHEHYRPPLPSTLPSYIHSLITRCWAHNPDDRPTFQAILNELLSNAHQQPGSHNEHTPAPQNDNQPSNTNTNTNTYTNSDDQKVNYYVND
jgi:serine/threonine protein kinase